MTVCTRARLEEQRERGLGDVLNEARAAVVDRIQREQGDCSESVRDDIFISDGCTLCELVNTSVSRRVGQIDSIRVGFAQTILPRPRDGAFG